MHIVTHFQGVYRGLVNYYRMAHNLSRRLNQVRYVLEVSMVKTLANKHQRSCASLWLKHKTKVMSPNGDVNAFEVRVKREGMPDLVARFGGLSLAREKFVPLEERVVEYWNFTNDLSKRLRFRCCRLCGQGGPVENHHVRRLADLRHRGDLPKWKKVMIQMRRKTLTVCAKCHDAIHAGRYDGPALS